MCSVLYKTLLEETQMAHGKSSHKHKLGDLEISRFTAIHIKISIIYFAQTKWNVLDLAGISSSQSNLTEEKED